MHWIRSERHLHRRSTHHEPRNSFGKATVARLRPSRQLTGPPRCLRLIPPENFSPEQCVLCDDMRRGIEGNFKDFATTSDDCELINPSPLARMNHSAAKPK